MGVKTDKRILDVTCGGRSIWFNKNHHLALYCDRREEEYEQTFGKAQPSTRHIKVHPDMIADFTDLPFDDNTFNLVVFDPPHIISLVRDIAPSAQPETHEKRTETHACDLIDGGYHYV